MLWEWDLISGSSIMLFSPPQNALQNLEASTSLGFEWRAAGNPGSFQPNSQWSWSKKHESWPNSSAACRLALGNTWGIQNWRDKKTWNQPARLWKNYTNLPEKKHLSVYNMVEWRKKHALYVVQTCSNHLDWRSSRKKQRPREVFNFKLRMVSP